MPLRGWPTALADVILVALVALAGGWVGGHASHGTRDLPFHYDLLTFRGEGGGTKVVAAVAVPAGELGTDRDSGQTRYRFDVRFVLADPERRSVVESIDSVFFAVPGRLPGDHLLHTVVELPDAPPSSTTEQRLVVTDHGNPGTGQIYVTPFPTPDYRGTELMLSDLAFGLPGAVDGWTRRGVTLALLPTSQFPESAFDVYYEIYNLPRGRSYETEVAIEPLGAVGGRQPVAARFSGESRADDQDTLGELRRIQSALPRGRYRITVTVQDRSSGESARKTTTIEVTGRRAGTTIVRALPKRSDIGG